MKERLLVPRVRHPNSELFEIWFGCPEATDCSLTYLQEKHPGKAGGPPGNAFDLVYALKTDKVYQNLYQIDPVLSEWIR